MNQDVLKSLLKYDYNSGQFVWIKRNSNRALVGAVAGSKTNTGYLSIRINKKSYLCHRLAWLYTFGVMPNGCVDHINTIKTDNRIWNLRICTPSENNYNVNMRKNNRVGVKGVSLYKQTGKYRARITVNKKAKHLGLFDSIDQAQKAYIEASRKYHGEFGRY